MSVDRKHYGTDYMAVLYAAGITDAVYEEDADAEELTKRILSRRSRRESREYYGIRSMDEVVSVLDILGKIRLNGMSIISAQALMPIIHRSAIRKSGIN